MEEVEDEAEEDIKLKMMTEKNRNLRMIKLEKAKAKILDREVVEIEVTEVAGVLEEEAMMKGLTKPHVVEEVVTADALPE